MIKINWFSPLNLDESPAARLTSNLLPTLQEYADIRVWTFESEAKYEMPWRGNIPIREYRTHHWHELNEADITIYNLDLEAQVNSTISWIGAHLPGMVILHDFELASLLGGSNLSPQPRHHQNLMRVGRIGSTTAMEFVKAIMGPKKGDFLPFHCHLSPECIQNALGIAVHSDDSFKYYSNLNQKSVCRFKLPFGKNSYQPSQKKSSRILVYESSEPWIAEFLKQIASISAPQECEVLICNEGDVSKEIKNLVRDLNLNSKVSFIRNPGISKIDPLLDQIGLLVHLPDSASLFARASEILLHTWNHSIPTIQLNQGDVRELPDHLVAKVSVELGADYLKKYLTHWFEEPNLWKLRGEQGKQRLEYLHSAQH
jgi:hypothetical protein